MHPLLLGAIAWVFLCVVAHPAAAQSKKTTQTLKAHAVAKVIQGSGGERVTIVFLEPRAKGEVLVKFQGVLGEWENRIFRHKRVELAANRENFELWEAQSEPNYVSIVNRNAAYDVYPKGAPRLPLRMAFAEAESKLVDVESVITEYLRSRR